MGNGIVQHLAFYDHILCVCKHLFVHSPTSARTEAIGQRSNVFLYDFPPYFLRQALTEPEAHCF